MIEVWIDDRQAGSFIEETRHNPQPTQATPGER